MAFRFLLGKLEKEIKLFLWHKTKLSAIAWFTKHFEHFIFLGWWGHISFLPFSSTISKVQNQSHRYNHKHLQLGSDDQHLKEHHWSLLWVKKSASPKENKSYKIRRQQEEGKEHLSAITCAGQQLLGVSSSPGCRCPHRRCCCSRQWFICTDPVHFKQNQLNIPHPTLSLHQKNKKEWSGYSIQMFELLQIGENPAGSPSVWYTWQVDSCHFSPRSMASTAFDPSRAGCPKLCPLFWEIPMNQEGLMPHTPPSKATLPPATHQSHN